MTRTTVQAFGLAVLICVGSACSATTSVRVQPDTVFVGPNTRPIAAIQANAISAYILFIPIPGVDLDRVVNQMLVVTAKSMGADKVANVRFDISPSGGIWKLREIFGYRSATASGIAVQVTTTAPDPSADLGPEPAETAPAPSADKDPTTP